MSRVLKGVVWKDDPRLVEAPSFPREEEDQEEMSGEVMENILANIRQKELTADRLVNEAKINSEIIQQNARAEAEKILQDAQQQADEIKAQAKEEGRQEGLEQGRMEGAEQIKQEQQQIILDANAKAQETMAATRSEYLETITKAENIIAEMVLQIASKVLPQHFIDVPQIILPLVQSAIEKVKDQPQVAVHVSPDSYGLVLMARSELQAGLEGKAELTVISDESLHNGDCLVESPNGTVDAKLSTQLELIEQAVRNVMK